MPSHKIDDVLPRIRERAEKNLGRQVDADALYAITLAAYNVIDIGVDKEGDIVPAAPIPSYQPQGGNAYWGGDGGRKRRSRY
jgi:hypothetical protein